MLRCSLEADPCVLEHRAGVGTTSWIPLSPPLLPLSSGLWASLSSEWPLRAHVRGGIAKDLGSSAVPPACFPPILDWEVQCEGMQLGLRHCGGFILKCCPHKQGSEPSSTILPKGTRLEQLSAKDTGICKALFTFFQIFPVKTFPCVRAAHCMALPSLLLAAFVFVAGFEWGIFHCSYQGLWYLGAYGWTSWGQWGFLVSNRGRIGRWIFVLIFQRFSCCRSPLAETSLQKSVSWEKQV